MGVDDGFMDKLWLTGGISRGQSFKFIDSEKVWGPLYI